MKRRRYLASELVEKSLEIDWQWLPERPMYKAAGRGVDERADLCMVGVSVGRTIQFRGWRGMEEPALPSAIPCGDAMRPED